MNMLSSQLHFQPFQLFIWKLDQKKAKMNEGKIIGGLLQDSGKRWWQGLEKVVAGELER
jgi:hypothetical protein